MSILNKLKNASGQKSNRLLEKHPLASESLELRLQYLASIALATAIDREATLAERQAFNGLAASLAIEASDAEEQFNERASVEEDAIVVLFDAIRKQGVGHLYILDLAWINSVTPNGNHSETESIEHLSELLGLNKRTAKSIYKFTQHLKMKNLKDALNDTVKSLKINEIRELLEEKVKKELDASDIIDDRWIIHDKSTATDATTGLTWMRKTIGETDDSNTSSLSSLAAMAIRKGFDIYKKGYDAKTQKEIKDEIEQKNLRESLSWRLPTKPEIEGITNSNNMLCERVFSHLAINSREIIYSQDAAYERKIKMTESGCKLIDELPDKKYLLLCRKR